MSETPHTTHPFWSDKDETEKVLAAGLHGTPELKPEERNQYLGEFREKVLAVLTWPAVKRPALDRTVLKAVKDPRAKALVLDADLEFEHLAKYVQLAKEHGLRYTMRSDPAHQADVGLVVISD